VRYCGSRRRWTAASPTPKIGAVLGLMALILVGVAVITVAAVLFLRPALTTEAREARDPGREGSEREVYEKLYGKHSATVSAPLPAEPPPKADADSPRTQKPSADPRTHRRSRAQDSHR
jgi:hypothetical protein